MAEQMLRQTAVGDMVPADFTITSRRRVNELMTRGVFLACALLLIVAILTIAWFIGSRGIATFLPSVSSSGQVRPGVNPAEFFFGQEWAPQERIVGAATFIVGSLQITLLSILISAPLSIAAALFLTEIGPKWAQNVLQPAVELFVGIPSVVYGWVGATVLVPFIRETFGGLGKSVLAGCIVLSIMALPTITTVATDAIRSLPVGLKEASYGLGATRWQTIARVLLPAALPGLLTAVILGMARAIGEALAVQMVIGNAFAFPESLLDLTITLTSVISMDMGNTTFGSTWNNALWTMAMLLLFIAFALIFAIRVVSSRKVYK